MKWLRAQRLTGAAVWVWLWLLIVMLPPSRAAEPPPFPAGASWTVERANTIPYPMWLHAGPDIRDDVKSILSSEIGNLQYWIKVAPGARGQIVVAVGEAYWSEPGHRLMDLLVDGRVCRRGIDPIAIAGGKHRLGTILCEAEDRDGDGRLRVQMVSAPGSPDHVTLLAGFWWFAQGQLTPEQAQELVRVQPTLHPDLFVPALTAEEVRQLSAAKSRGDRERIERERQARTRTEQGLAKLPQYLNTENPALNALAEKIFAQCIFSKLYDPIPPALPNQWFSPGGGYVGQWIWDTMFVVNAYAPMNEDAVIRGVFDNYWQTLAKNPEAPAGSYRYGMVPNFLKPWPPHGYSQIPILAWGALRVYRQTNDRELLEQALPYLLAFDHWYATERDVDEDGLIEFGAYKPVGHASMVQTARYETFDLFPPMDDMKLTRHPKRATGGPWYGNVEGVDQTCFLLMSERALVEIARVLGREKLARRFEKVIARRITALQAKMWNPEKRFFYSLDRDTDRQIPVRCIQGFLTLCCDAATPDQARMLAKQLQNPKQWWCAYPVPTVALDDPKFDPRGFWRGDMWPVTTYLVAYGLNRYGYHDLARQLTDRIVALTAQHGINERYDGTTGKPLGVTGLGMSCSIWSMVVENDYGIGDDFRTIRFPAQAKGRHLRLGKLGVRFPSDNVVELQSAFARRFKVVFPATDQPFKVRVTDAGRALSPSQYRVSDNQVQFNAAPGKTYQVSRRFAADHRPPTGQAGFYTPPHRPGEMWDTWLYWHEGTFFLYYIAGPGGRWDAHEIATSTDGVHWRYRGVAVTPRPGTKWIGTGHVWRSPDFARNGRWILNYSEWFGDRQDIMFATSTDLLHWTKVDETLRFVQDTRWYQAKGRWDCIDVVRGDDGWLYGYFTATPDPAKVDYPHCGFGFARSRDGLHWEALPPVRGNLNGEFGGIQKIGDRYYITMSEGRIGVGSSPQGPFGQQQKNPNAFGGNIYFPRFFHTAPGGPLMNHFFKDGPVYAAPLKAIEIDREGVLRLVWWPGNETLKAARLPVKMRDLQGSIRWIEPSIDGNQTIVVEGTVHLPDPDSAEPALRGILIDQGNGSAGLVAFERRQTRFGPIQVDASPMTMTVRQTANRDLDYGRHQKFRLLLNRDMMEVYVNDYLTILARARNTGRLGLLTGPDAGAIADLRIWRDTDEPEAP